MLLALLLAQASNFIAVGGGGGMGTDGGAFGFTVGYQRGGQRFRFGVSGVLAIGTIGDSLAAVVADGAVYLWTGKLAPYVSAGAGYTWVAAGNDGIDRYPRCPITGTPVTGVSGGECNTGSGVILTGEIGIELRHLEPTGHLQIGLSGLLPLFAVKPHFLANPDAIYRVRFLMLMARFVI